MTAMVTLLVKSSSIAMSRYNRFALFFWACKFVKNKDLFFQLVQEHSSRHGKVIQDDHSDNMSHNACYF